MRTDICAREDDTTQASLLEALAAVGAMPEDDSPLEIPLSTGLHRFRVGFETLTVFVDAWLVDLEGPDEPVKRVIERMSGRDRGS
jgi:hypothetical protein